MKTFRQLMNEMMTSTGGGVAGMHQSVEPLDGLPQIDGRETDRIAIKKKRTVKRESFAGCPVFTVSSDEYAKCMHGRMRYERWNKKLDMEDLNNQEIREYSYSNPGKSVIIKDETYGTMSYFIPRHNTNESMYRRGGGLDISKKLGRFGTMTRKEMEGTPNASGSKPYRGEKSKPHGIKSDPAYIAAKTKKQIKQARDQYNLKNLDDPWVGESVEFNRLADRLDQLKRDNQ